LVFKSAGVCRRNENPDAQDELELCELYHKYSRGKVNIKWKMIQFALMRRKCDLRISVRIVQSAKW